MLYQKAVTPQIMKKMNRAWVIDLLTKKGPISQTQICEITGLSRATVSTIITALRKEDLVKEVKRAESTSGRRQVLLELNAKAGYVIGVDLGGRKMIGAVTDLTGDVICDLQRSTHADAGPEATYENLCAFLHDLISLSKIPEERIKGVGIGVPGVVLDNTVVKWAPSLDWLDLNLAERLRRRFLLPFFIENDVNLQALGEYWYGLGQGIDHLVCLTIGTGLGAGIILGGQLFRGFHQSAGEICNMVTKSSELGSSYPGYGFLESRASGTAIAEQYGAVANVEGPIEAETVFALARQGDDKAKKIVADFAQHLSMAIVSISTILDPQRIILGGGVSLEADCFLPKLKELAFPVLQAVPDLVVSELAHKAGVMGAIALTLHNTNENPFTLSEFGRRMENA